MAPASFGKQGRENATLIASLGVRFVCLMSIVGCKKFRPLLSIENSRRRLNTRRLANISSKHEKRV